jgi:hypothetical protein
MVKDFHNKAFESGDLLVEVGNYAFTTTGTTVEVPTNLSGTAIGVFLTPKTVTYNANDRLSSDGVVTTNAITVHVYWLSLRLIINGHVGMVAFLGNRLLGHTPLSVLKRE